MSFVDQKRGPSPAGLASSIIVQAAIGAAVIAGLTITDFAKPDEEKDWKPIDYKLPPPPKPPEKLPKPEVIEPKPSQPDIFIPDPPISFDAPAPEVDFTDILPPPSPPSPIPSPRGEVAPPAPVPSFSPVPARPRNDPGAWLRDSDYRSSWARRELVGVAGFQLDIAVNGKVTGCRITSSTGHEELDQATCRLVQRRAKFQPARGPNGEPVTGSFRSSVRWQLPE